MLTKTDAVEQVKSFLSLVSKEISIEKAYLFGSYAHDKQEKYSDIDLAIVSKEFEGTRFFDRKRLAKFIVESNSDIEVHPFKSDDFNENDPFVNEIIKTGKRII